MIRVLVIDPDKQMDHTIEEGLEAAKMAVCLTHDKLEALRQLETEPPDAVVLAVGHSASYCEGLCRQVCARTLAPLLVVGQRNQDLAVERALAAGADAHVLHPFSQGVFLAQLWALLRRVGLTRTPKGA